MELLTFSYKCGHKNAHKLSYIYWHIYLYIFLWLAKNINMTCLRFKVFLGEKNE